MVKISVKTALATAKHNIGLEKYLEAKRICKAILKAHPNNGTARKLLATLDNKMTGQRNENLPAIISNIIATYNKGDFIKSYAASKKSLSIYPDVVEILKIFGASASRVGKFHEATSAFKKIVSINPDEPRNHFNLGNALRDQGQIHHALKAYVEALRIDITYEPARSNLAKLIASNNLEKEPSVKRILSGTQMESLVTEAPIMSEVKHAEQFFEMGKYDQAKKYYERAFSRDPTNAILAFNLGLSNAKLGKFDNAINSYEEAISLQPEFPDAQNNLGLALIELNHLDKAISVFETMISQDARSVKALINLGAVYEKKDLIEDALFWFRNAILVSPNDTVALYNCARILAKNNQLEEAEKIYKKLLKIDPNYTDAEYNLANVYVKLQNYEAAIIAYKNVLFSNPNYRAAQFNLADALWKMGKPEDAIPHYKDLMSKYPNYTDAYLSLAVIYSDQQEFEVALDLNKKAIAINNKLVPAYFNSARILIELGKFDQGIETYKTALSLEPDSTDILNNLGIAYAEKGSFDCAINTYEKALRLNANDPEVKHNLSYALLASGQFIKGFRLNEERWKTQKNIGVYFNTSKPVWSEQKNRRVLIWGEQGIGDEIMYSSIIPELCEKSSHVLVRCDERLINLFKRSFPENITYFPSTKLISEAAYDYHLPIGSLPMYFRRSLGSFKKASLGFLSPDEERSRKISSALSSYKDKKLIGISWKTKSSVRNATKRNLSLSDLARKIIKDDVKLVNLQYGDVSDDIFELETKYGIKVLQLKDLDITNDIDGLASLMSNCDEIISTTNMTVHLAGALGLKTKVLVPYSPRWIWGDGSQNYWYDSVCPFKQTKVNEWTEVLNSLCN